ncbi:hypothetical protein AAG906_019242 [Vitis piasezkii]
MQGKQRKKFQVLLTRELHIYMEKISILGFILAILYFITIELACNGHTHIDNNVQSEQNALIDFKSGLKDPNNRLSSWKGSNYCYWKGISCENGTGFVISIDLHNPYPRENVYENWSSMNLSGEISPSLIKLKSLKYLDLSFNSFKAMPIPQFFGLEFSGSIPPNLGNLSNLQYLDLSSYYSNNLFVQNIEWMTGLVSLKYLGMNYVNLSLVGSRWVEPLWLISEWLLNVDNLVSIDISENQLHGRIPLGLGELPNLQYLDLSGNFNLRDSIFQLLRKSWKKIEVLNLARNELHGSIPSSIGNFCNLKYLDLSFNLLNGSLPEIIKGLETCSSKSPLPNLTELSLYDNQLMGKLPNWLGELKNLRVLDLSSNKFEGPIPASLWTLQHLESLYLGWNELNGSLPDSIGQLSQLQVLDVSFNHLSGSLPDSIGQLSQLQVLDVSFNHLSGSLPDSIGQLSQLQILDVSSNHLSGSLPDSIGQLSQLQMLDVSSNHLSGSLSEQHFWKLSKLEYLRMDSNSFHLNVSPNWVPPFQVKYLRMDSCHLGPSFPAWLQSQKNLEYLDFSNGSISSPIPNWFWNISFNLQWLYLSHNQLQGQLPNSLKFYNQLDIDFSSNLFEGSIPFQLNGLGCFFQSFEWKSPDSIGQLSQCNICIKLEFLRMGSNSFHLNVSPNWVPLSQVNDLDMGSCHLGPSFPAWSQKNLRFLDLSNCRHFKSHSKLVLEYFFNMERLFLPTIDLSVINFRHFSTKRGKSMLGLNYLMLSNNQITGFIPLNIGKSMPNLSYLSLSSNQITGAIPSNIGEFLPSLQFLSLSGNRIIGTIPDSIGHLTSLEVIDFSRNNLTGSIPSTINNCSSLVILDLGNNNLSGMIPKSLGQLQSLQSLHLNHNKLSGELPSSLQNLTGLDVLDLSYNRLSGQVPAWIGAAFVNLVILNLRSNLFFGRLPSRLSNLSSLHVLDIAQNNLMGEIPITLVELKAMAQEQLNIYRLNVNATRYEERLVVIAKGQSLEYTKTLSLVVGIDLSDNNLSGEFPQEITKLFGLVVLNLSRNHITGQIPKNISMLRQLSSLDLSSNKLSGTIPSSMASLSFLSYLNLSNNNFSCKIPFGANDNLHRVGLCGKPDLYEDPNKRQSVVSDKNGGYVDQWFYLSVGLGFAMGILVPFFVLATRKSWCEAYFDFVDEIVRWLLRGRATYAKNHPRRR